MNPESVSSHSPHEPAYIAGSTPSHATLVFNGFDSNNEWRPLIRCFSFGIIEIQHEPKEKRAGAKRSRWRVRKIA